MDYTVYQNMDFTSVCRKKNMSFRFLFSKYKYTLHIHKSQQCLSLIDYIVYYVGVVVVVIVWWFDLQV